ncbi:hypothetical protein Q1695_005290 [Nippostrongylus brasiliensis]|nr:hypothetical protein Q1695_005290 [Nippostrongylus brasiliensis]
MIGEQEKLRDVRKEFADYQSKDVDKQEDEKFEVVANARPAEAHMRNSTLKWKHQPIINLFDDAHENERLMVAVKALAIMWFYKLFDEVLTKEEIQTLKAYFTSSSSNQDLMTVIPVIDKAIGHSMRIMRKNPDRFDKLVDYQMLTFLKFSKKAKPVVLEAMMICPEYIPESWGGKDCERLFTARLAEVSSQMMLAPQENKKGPSGEKIPNKAKPSKEEVKKEESKDAQKVLELCNY